MRGENKLSQEAQMQKKPNIYLNLVKNKTLMLIWSGSSISLIGDAFFNLAVMWVVYAQSGSTLQSALVGVVSQLSFVIMSPLSGALADRWNRKTMMWSTNILSAIVVGLLTFVFFIMGYLPLWAALVAILLLDTLSVFLYPAESSVMPDIVGKEQLSNAFGVTSTIKESANLVGKGLAGVTIAVIGTGWALSWDSLSFILATLCILIARIPNKQISLSNQKEKSSLIGEMKEGWSYMNHYPVLKIIIWLAFLVNVSSFMGPLYPALVKTQLHGGATTFGLIESSSVVGAMIGGICTGFFDQRFKTGILLGWSLFFASLATFGIAISHFIIITMLCQVIQSFCTTLVSVLLTSALLVMVADEFRGRISGLVSSMAMLAMPISTLIAGGIGIKVNVSYLIWFGALWVFAIALFTLFNKNMRHLDTKESIR
jgi:MFS transporter, DHA3 family, macrolide efflux protein